MPSDTFSLSITDIALPSSFGVGKQEGFVVFVPGAVTGDRVRIKLTKRGKRFSYGEIMEVEEPSPSRVAPHCPHFGSCGGCTLQHYSYDEQLALKERHLRQALVRIGKLDADGLRILPIAASPHQYFSRNKVELAFGKDGSRTIIGLRERVSAEGEYEGRVTPLGKCPAFSEAYERIVPSFSEFVSLHNLSPYDPITRRGFLRHLTLRESKSTGEVMAILETSPGPLPDATDLGNRLRESAPEVTGLYRAINSGTVDTGRYEQENHLFGKRFIEESLCGFTFRIYPQSFFQPNTGVARLLYQAILDLPEVRNQGRIVGLYCGMGPIEMLLSLHASEVTGIDSNPANIRNGKENCSLNGIGNCTFIEGKVERVRGRIPLSPDVLVIDPPRGGISKEGMETILRLTPGRIIYVSCNPSTLARDLGVLATRGYEARRISPFDAFPHTGHLESLAVIERIRRI